MKLKNLKSKLRKITVNDKIYFWFCGNPNCDGDDGNLLRIYHNKKIVFHDVVKGSVTVTPKYVSDIINEKFI